MSHSIADLPSFLTYQIGSFLSLFLGRDGGPREGAIQLPQEKLNIPPPIPEEEDSSSQVFEDEDEPRGLAQRLTKKISRRFSELFANRSPDIHHTSNGPPSSHPAMPLASASGTRLDRTRTFSTSRTNGSAYGYSNNYRNLGEQCHMEW